MKHPTFPEQNYALHILASSFVELFPKLQLLDFSVFPDRFCIDFSFASALSAEELQMLKDRFFLKIERKEKGEIKEMVSKNACDMLKHHKQIFLTELVDREEMFTDMLCMDVYQAPLIGEIDQDCAFKGLKLEMYDVGEKKWMKRKVHHYRMEGFPSFSENPGKVSLDQMHEAVGKERELFWVEDGQIAFSGSGEEKFEELFEICTRHFGEKAYLDLEPSAFAKISGIKDFYVSRDIPGMYDGIGYGLKETDYTRCIVAYSFSGKDLTNGLKRLVSELGLTGEFDKRDKFIIYDYKGIPWVVAETDDDSKNFSIEVNLQCIFALMLEKSM